MVISRIKLRNRPKKKERELPPIRIRKDAVLDLRKKRKFISRRKKERTWQMLILVRVTRLMNVIMEQASRPRAKLALIKRVRRLII